MAQLGYHVSMGLDLWDYPVRKGTVLYLALEDDYARLQKRLSRMFGMESSENFYFATQSSKEALRDQAIAKLMHEIQAGRDSVKSESDWITEDEMLARYGIK